MRTITRFLTFAILIVTATVLSVHADNDRTGAPWTFAQVADPQLGEPKELWQYQEAIRNINASGVDLVLICGDLVRGPGNEMQNEWFQTATKKFRAPTYLVAGNHDVGNIWTTESVAKYREWYGKDYYSFEHRGVLFIALNSNLFRPEGNAGGREQWEWLETELRRKLAGGKRQNYDHVIMFMHHPLFTKSSQEPEEYFNIPMQQRKRMLDLIENYQIPAVLTGHSHKNNVVEYRGTQFVTTDSTAFTFTPDDGLGYRIWTVTPGALTHEYKRIDTTEAELAGRMASSLVLDPLNAEEFKAERTATLKREVRNLFDKPARISYRWTLPTDGGWRVVPETLDVEIPPKGATRVNFVITSSGGPLRPVPIYAANLIIGSFNTGPEIKPLAFVKKALCRYQMRGVRGGPEVQIERLVMGPKPRGENDCRAQASWTHDHENVYCYVRVIDDDVTDGTPENILSSDSVSVAVFSGTRSARYPWTLCVNVRPSSRGTLTRSFPPAEGVSGNVARTEDGYEANVTIPLTAVNLDSAAREYSFRADISVKDMDSGQAAVSVFNWNGEHALLMDTNDYGVVEMR